MEYPKKNKYGEIIFKDFPDFTPNLTPIEIFELGSFGGTYWRQIKSSITNKKYENVHKKYPEEWWKNIKDDKLTNKWDNYNVKVNKYNVKVGSTLEEWGENKWITENHPYGWVHWYCDFYIGKRCSDDNWQIKRWIQTAGKNSRFRRALINLIYKKNTLFDDFLISPKRRQTLQHWGYILTEKDCIEK